MNKDQDTYTVRIEGVDVVVRKNDEGLSPFLSVLTDDIQVIEFQDLTFTIRFKKGSHSSLKMSKSNTLPGYFIFTRDADKFTMSKLYIGDNYYYS